MSVFSIESLMSLLDHSLLKPDMTNAELEAGCHLARNLGAASVCLLPYFVERCAEILAGSRSVPSTTIGFPHGAVALQVKLSELDVALRGGAKEVDAVVNISLVKSGQFDRVEREITELTERTHARAARIKIILEMCYLSRDEKIRLCEISGRAGADWVKTSTGFGSYGATPEDVSLLKEHAPEPVQVKASGGIRTLEDVLQYQRLGATRVGTSALKAIHSEARRRFLA